MSERRRYSVPTVRHIAEVIAILVSGWMLLAYNGLRTIERDWSRGWHIYPLPSYPTPRAALYLVVGGALSLIAAWLIRPGLSDQHAQQNATGALWQNYCFRLCFSVASAFLAAVILAFVSMALTDAGF